MNETLNKLLLARDRFISEMHLKHLDLLIVLVDHSLTTNKEYKNIKKQEFHDIFIKTN